MHPKGRYQCQHQIIDMDIFRNWKVLLNIKEKCSCISSHSLKYMAEPELHQCDNEHYLSRSQGKHYPSDMLATSLGI